jgi:hypothetical protein
VEGQKDGSKFSELQYGLIFGSLRSVRQASCFVRKLDILPKL